MHFLKHEHDHNHFEKGGPDLCEFCDSHQNTLVRVFESYAEFTRSPYYAGSDNLQSEPRGATHAVWPGKNNAGRGRDFWLCAPAHPHCDCHWVHEGDIDIQLEEEYDDWFAELEEIRKEKEKQGLIQGAGE